MLRQLVQFDRTHLRGASLALASFSLAAVGYAQTPAGLPLPVGEGFSRQLDAPAALGVFSGIFFPSRGHEFVRGAAEPKAFAAVGPELGVRVTTPLSGYWGVETEGALMPTETRDDGAAALLMALREQVFAQYSLAAFTPFLTAGVGAIGATSETNGFDLDLGIHLGVGAKLPLGKTWHFRFDFRDTVSRAPKGGVLPHHLELLIGLALELGTSNSQVASHRPPTLAVISPHCRAPAPQSTVCPVVACVAVTPPKEVETRSESGALSPDPCLVLSDFPPDGCPEHRLLARESLVKAPLDCSTTGEGLPEDSCLKTLPPSLQGVLGVIDGIEFGSGTPVIRKASYKVLDEAAALLNQLHTLEIEIVGHSDSTGDHDRNQWLSEERAISVLNYLQRAGVAGSRLRARGAGADEPISSNKTLAGRQQNRRIEFKLLN